MRTVGIVAETKSLQKTMGTSHALMLIEEDEFLSLLNIYCDPLHAPISAAES